LKEQLNLFHYVKDMDPIYQNLKKLRKGDSYKFRNFLITINPFGIYEIEGEDIHEASRNLDKCYEILMELIETEKNGY